LLFLLAAAFFAVACAKPLVVGQVVDQCEKPLEGAKVAIANSQFSATTNQDGKYRVDFLPGRFAVTFTKEGYSSARLDLDIQTKDRFPAQTVILWKLPGEPGIFALDKAACVYSSVSSHPAALGMAGTLLQAFTGIRSLRHLPVHSRKPVFVFYGPNYGDNVTLSRLHFAKTARVQNIFGPAMQAINLWVANENKVELKLDKIDPGNNFFSVQPAAELAPGNYAFHWGVLFANDPMAMASSSNREVYDWEIVAETQPAPMASPPASAGAPISSAAGAPANPAITQEIKAFLDDWRAAWEGIAGVGRTPAYTACYADDFYSTTSRMNLPAWLTDKQAKYGKKKSIKVVMSDVAITPTGENGARVEFTQAFQSDNYHDVGKKILVLRKINGRWKITAEDWFAQ
jgi:hypothetical protein